MNFFDMEHCHGFLDSRQHTEPYRLLEDEIVRHHVHASKQLEIISWFHTSNISVHSLDPKFTQSPDTNTVF